VEEGLDMPGQEKVSSGIMGLVKNNPIVTASVIAVSGLLYMYLNYKPGTKARIDRHGAEFGPASEAIVEGNKAGKNMKNDSDADKTFIKNNEAGQDMNNILNKRKT